MKIGWFGKNGVQGTNLLDRFISVLGCLKSVQNSLFRSRPAIFPVFPSPDIDDVLSLKNTKFAECLEFINPRELEIKETMETVACSSYLDCYLYIDNGKLTTRLYYKRDDFSFPNVNFPFLSSNIPSTPACFTVNPLCQNLFKLSGFHGVWESAHYKVVEPGVSKKPNW